MSIDQQNDNHWKELMAKKGILLSERSTIIHMWINESDGTKRVQLRNQEGEYNRKLGEIDSELQTYVDSQGGY